MQLNNIFSFRKKLTINNITIMKKQIQVHFFKVGILIPRLKKKLTYTTFRINGKYDNK